MSGIINPVVPPVVTIIAPRRRAMSPLMTQTADRLARVLREVRGLV